MRPFLSIIVFLGAVFGPPWIPIIAAILLTLRYPAYEVILAALLMDFLWQPIFPYSVPLYTLAALILVWGLEPLRKELLFR